jgi:hypothetical protein
MTTLASLSDSQVSPEIVLNENFQAVSHVGIFGKRHAVTSGLTWGYYGGLWRSVNVANGTLALTDDTDNYVVAERATGIVSVATATTDWDDSAYVRLYKLTTASGLVTVEEDHRAGSLFGAAATGVSSVNGQTDAVTVEAIVHAATGKTTPVDADEFGIVDSAASNVLKKLTWANLKATLKTYLDTVHAAIGAITGSGLTMATGKLLGRSTASTGAIEEITVGSGLSLSAGTLSATAAGGDASTNTSTSVDSEVALFSGTGGKTLKRATGTGLAKLTSGVLTTATAGTDYYNPGGTDVALADGGTGASTAAGARANLQVGQAVLAIACSDESTGLTTGTNKVKFINPYSTAFNVTAVVASLSTAQTSGSIFTVDINEAGTSILSTKLTIDNTETNSSTAATPAVISDASIAAYAEIEVDIDQVGDGTAKGLKVYLIGYPS